MALYEKDYNKKITNKKQDVDIDFLNQYVKDLLVPEKIKIILNYILAVIQCVHKSGFADKKYKRILQKYTEIFKLLFLSLPNDNNKIYIKTYYKILNNFLNEQYGKFYLKKKSIFSSGTKKTLEKIFKIKNPTLKLSEIGADSIFYLRLFNKDPNKFTVKDFKEISEELYGKVDNMISVSNPGTYLSGGDGLQIDFQKCKFNIFKKKKGRDKMKLSIIILFYGFLRIVNIFILLCDNFKKKNKEAWENLKETPRPKTLDLIKEKCFNYIPQIKAVNTTISDTDLLDLLKKNLVLNNPEQDNKINEYIKEYNNLISLSQSGGNIIYGGAVGSYDKILVKIKSKYPSFSFKYLVFKLFNEHEKNGAILNLALLTDVLKNKNKNKIEIKDFVQHMVKNIIDNAGLFTDNTKIKTTIDNIFNDSGNTVAQKFKANLKSITPSEFREIIIESFGDKTSLINKLIEVKDGLIKETSDIPKDTVEESIINSAIHNLLSQREVVHPTTVVQTTTTHKYNYTFDSFKNTLKITKEVSVNTTSTTSTSQKVIICESITNREIQTFDNYNINTNINLAFFKYNPFSKYCINVGGNIINENGLNKTFKVKKKSQSLFSI